ncbi:MAG TPA: hypothetical protein DCM32_03230, partial [Xanthomonadaceae bacterium]|nr:hypothetical protein [Xanthomonadaceae bacterium]
ATYAHKLDKAEAKLDWTQPAVVLARKIRAFNPWPIAECELAGERLRVHGAVTLSEAAARALGVDRHAPGALIAGSREGLVVACGEGALCLTQVQREGGKPQPVADFLNARPQWRTP